MIFQKPIILDADEFERFMECLEAPPEPNECLVDDSFRFGFKKVLESDTLEEC